MQINEIDEGYIREITDDDTVLARGIDYFKRGRVKELRFEGDKLKAKVKGSDKDYDVTITLSDGEIESECNCPYKGYICKHIVAVLHKLIITRKPVEESVEDDFEYSLNKKTKEELVSLIIELKKEKEEYLKRFNDHFL